MEVGWASIRQRILQLSGEQESDEAAATALVKQQQTSRLKLQLDKHAGRHFSHEPQIDQQLEVSDARRHHKLLARNEAIETVCRETVVANCRIESQISLKLKGQRPEDKRDTSNRFVER